VVPTDTQLPVSGSRMILVKNLAGTIAIVLKLLL
jgi:hypothetical protein